MASADTAVDDQPQHTAQRAALAGWLTPGYARAQLRASIAAAPGNRWEAWRQHRAYLIVTAKLSGDDHPADTEISAARMVLLSEQPVGRDRWRAEPITEVVAVVLTKANGVWRIANDQTS